MQIRKKIVLLIFIISIASTSLYFVANNLPSGLGSHIFLWAPLALLTAFFYKPIIFRKTPLFQILVFGILSAGLLQHLLWGFMDEWNKSVILSEFYVILYSITLLSYFYHNRDVKGLASIGKYGFFFILITSITTLVALFIDPMIVRNSAGGYGLTPSDELLFDRLGVGGYGFVMGLACLLPIIVYYIRLNSFTSISRRVWIVILLILLFVILKAQIFANILIAALITILAFTNSRNLKRTYFFLGFFAIIILLVPDEMYSNSIRILGHQFPKDSETYSKLIDLANYIEAPDTESTETGSRTERYPILFEAFIDSPMLGDSSYPSKHFIIPGSHLHWMNRLTLWGLLGFAFYIYILFQIYKFTANLFEKNFLFYYNLSVIAVIMLGLMKAITGREMWLMILLIVPGMYFWPMISNNGKSKNYN